MEDYQLLIDLHKNANRQGPGGDAETEKALSLAMTDRAAPLKIADIGCGTGASTLLLARLLKAQITAVDFKTYPGDFIRSVYLELFGLSARALAEGLAVSPSTLN